MLYKCYKDFFCTNQLDKFIIPRCLIRDSNVSDRWTTENQVTQLITEVNSAKLKSDHSVRNICEE